MRSSTPTFSVQFKLDADKHIKARLEKSFKMANYMYNRLISHARSCLNALKHDPEYNRLLKEYRDPDIKNRSEITKRLNELTLSYGLSEYSFHAYVKKQQNMHKNLIDSNTSQKIASTAWEAVSDCLYRNGNTVHFRKLEDCISLEGKSNDSGIKIRSDNLIWFDMKIRLKIKTQYEKEAFEHRVKYARIVRIPLGIKWHYYVQVVFEGVPPEKHKFTDGTVGVDIGVSTIAAVSEDKAELISLPVEDTYADRIKFLQQKLDTLRRKQNPANYNTDGTIKKGKKKWIFSGNYQRLRMRLKTLYRKRASSLKQREETIANKVLSEYGTDIFIEDMDFDELKEVKTSKGEKKDVSFGKSIQRASPSQMISIMNRKLNYIGKNVYKVDKYNYKASQYNHLSDTYIKSELDERTKFIGNTLVQRDMYSAFLLMCNSDLKTINRTKCFRLFDKFIVNQTECINTLLNEKAQKSFGLDDFRAIA